METRTVVLYGAIVFYIFRPQHGSYGLLYISYIFTSSFTFYNTFLRFTRFISYNLQSILNSRTEVCIHLLITAIDNRLISVYNVIID